MSVLARYYIMYKFSELLLLYTTIIGEGEVTQPSHVSHSEERYSSAKNYCKQFFLPVGKSFSSS